MLNCAPTPGEALHCLQTVLDVYPADDRGFEGIACVDDTARAAVLALQVYEMTQSAVALDLACAWLRFVMYMQGERDQRMLNLILDATGTHGNGKTSYPGGEPWSVRGPRLRRKMSVASTAAHRGYPANLPS
jgi:hypothetical protein